MVAQANISQGYLRLRAENETRTRDPNLGKVVLYQLSYFRIALLKQKRLFRFCECKGMKFLFNLQIFSNFFIRKSISGYISEAYKGYDEGYRHRASIGYKSHHQRAYGTSYGGHHQQ